MLPRCLSHAPAVHSLSRLTVLRPPTPATPYHQPPTRTDGAIPTAAGHAQLVALASLDTTAPAGHRARRAAEAAPQRVNTNLAPSV